VAISGDRIAVGARREYGELQFFERGAAYVFLRSGSSWAQEARIVPSNLDIDDHFGSAVDIEGQTVVVGVNMEDSALPAAGGGPSDNSSSNSGALYVFARSAGEWVEANFVKPSNSESLDAFGGDAAISGEWIVAGAPGEDGGSIGTAGDPFDNAAPSAGAALAFRRGLFLLADPPTHSLTTGGQVQLDLDAGVEAANWFYWVFGSVTGSSPGLTFPGGLHLPLNYDLYFEITITKLHLGAFADFTGQLDAAGQARATLTLPAGLDPSLAGVRLNHAFLAAAALGQAELASNAVSTLLVP
jgi:hypothetical protein